MAIEINAADVSRAEQFLETLLTEQVTDGRFTKGSALRDLAVKAFAFIFAHLQKENEQVRALQSLLNIQKIAVTDPDLDRAVAAGTDAILSNWFVRRKPGGFARGMLTIRVSKRQDYIIPGNNRFAYDRTRAFYPDVPDPSQNSIVNAEDLQPVTGIDGTITSYQFRFRVVAAKVGASYNVDPAIWQGGRQFSPYVLKIFNDVKFEGGRGKETTDELIDRAGSAISVRNLINAKSIDAVLREKFSALQRLLVVGMGDEEMIRDLKLEGATKLEIHVGGHYDIYAELPRVQTAFEGSIGGQFSRPDGIINVFRDSTVSDWTATDVQLGDVIRIASGLPNAPRDFLIKEILESELRVSVNSPFSEATDEAGTTVTYYIYRPLYGADIQIVPAIGSNTTGITSKVVQTPNRLVLPGGPHYDIIDVIVTDPDLADPNIDPTDGYVHFPVRVNTTPSTVAAGDNLEYQILNNNPGTAQSQIAFEELIVNPDYNNKRVRVTYETLAGFETIHSFVTDRFERISAANCLLKGFLPIYVSCQIPYKLKPTATSSIDESALQQAVVSFINTFNPKDVLDVSDISQRVRQFSPQIGSVLPFDISYQLIVPDGRTILFTTSDEVRIDPARVTDTRANATLSSPLTFGISDRNVRYMTSTDRITVLLQ